MDAGGTDYRLLRPNTFGVVESVCNEISGRHFGIVFRAQADRTREDDRSDRNRKDPLAQGSAPYEPPIAFLLCL